MRILNLYAGIGGNRKLWPDEHHVTAVEYSSDVVPVYERLYPEDRVHETDAHTYLMNHVNDFDFIWSSPPCQSHTQMVKATRHRSQLSRYPDMRLYEEIVFLQHRCEGKWVVENVEPYYGAMRPDGVFMQQVGRHIFWSNFQIYAEDVPTPDGFIYTADLPGQKVMEEWLGIELGTTVYLGDNHCPVQILRNAVHPEMGLQVLESAVNAGAGWKDNTEQLGMFYE